MHIAIAGSGMETGPLVTAAWCEPPGPLIGRGLSLLEAEAAVDALQ